MNSADPFFLNQLLIVIVVYEQKISETRAFASLDPIRKNATILIYDNSQAPQEFSKFSNLIYRHDEKNPGVSKAYNTAAQLADEKQKTWLLLADQDTLFPDSFLFTYQQALTEFPNEKLFAPILADRKGVISPFSFHHAKGKRLSSALKPGVHNLMTYRIVNSGIMVSVRLFEKAGGYDERFSLDYSDIVFTDRLLLIHSFFVLVNSLLKQNFSGSSEKNTVALLKRFNSFCSTVLLYKKTVAHQVPLLRVLLPRAIKLSLQTRNFQFLKILNTKHYEQDYF